MDLNVCSHLSVALVQSVVLFLHVWFSLLQPSDWQTDRDSLAARNQDRLKPGDQWWSVPECNFFLNIFFTRNFIMWRGAVEGLREPDSLSSTDSSAEIFPSKHFYCSLSFYHSENLNYFYMITKVWNIIIYCDFIRLHAALCSVASGQVASLS